MTPAHEFTDNLHRVKIFRVYWRGGHWTSGHDWGPAVTGMSQISVYLSDGPSTTAEEFDAADVLVTSSKAGSAAWSTPAPIISAGVYDLQVVFTATSNPPGANPTWSPTLPSGMVPFEQFFARALSKIGFSPTQIKFLTQTRDAAAIKRHRHDWTRAKLHALTTSGQTMTTLLRAKFTRAQAKVLITNSLVT